MSGGFATTMVWLTCLQSFLLVIALLFKDLSFVKRSMARLTDRVTNAGTNSVWASSDKRKKRELKNKKRGQESWEINKKEIKMQKKLAKGNFG